MLVLRHRRSARAARACGTPGADDVLRIWPSARGSTRRNVLSPAVPFALKPGLDVQAVRVQVRRVRAVRHVDVPGKAARVDERRPGCPRRTRGSGRRSVRPFGASCTACPRPSASGRTRPRALPGRCSNGSGAGPFGTRLRFGPRWLRSVTRRRSSPRMRIVGPGLDPLKLNSGVNRLPGDVARGGCALPTMLQRERLVWPLGRPPDPRFGPVLGVHASPRFGDGLGGRRLRRLRPLPRAGRLRGRRAAAGWRRQAPRRPRRPVAAVHAASKGAVVPSRCRSI